MNTSNKSRHSSRSRNFTFTSAFVFFVLFSLVSCADIVEIEPTPPAPVICPTVAMTQPPQFLTSPMLLFVLVEGSPSHRDYTLSLLNEFSRSLPHILRPGDQLVLALMEPRTLEASIVVNIKSTPIPTPVLPTPLPSPTVVELAVESSDDHEPQSKIAEMSATRIAEMTREAFYVTSTRYAEEFNCELYAWNDQYQNTVDDWYKANATVTGELTEKANEGIRNIDPESFQETTRVFESLSLSSLLLRQECHNYETCALLVFSDLSEWRYDRPEDLEVNFSGVDIFVILSDCTFLYQTNCADRIERWASHFSAYQARTVNFATSENVEKTLRSFFQR